MFKKVLSITLTVMMAVGLMACGSKEEVTEVTTSDSAGDTAAVVEEVEFDGNFIVGFDAEFPPFGSIDDSGEYVGFDLDLAREVCERNGWEFTAQPIDWDAKDMELESGSISCIWNGFTMTGREDEYTWTVPYVDSSIIVVVGEDSDIQTLDDLAGKNVMVQVDSSGLAALEDEENASLTESFGQLEQISDYNTAFMNLESGAVDAVVVDIGVGNQQMAAKEGKFRALDSEITVEQYAVGFKLGNESLRDAVEKTLFEMLEDGTFDEIAEKWADDGLPNMICLANYK